MVIPEAIIGMFGGFSPCEVLLSHFTAKGIDWGSGKAWRAAQKIVNDKKHGSPICRDLYDVVEKCVNQAVSIGDNRINACSYMKIQHVDEPESLFQAYEIIYEAMAQNGLVDKKTLQKVKSILANDSINIVSSDELNILLYEEICSEGDKYSSLFKYLLAMNLIVHRDLKDPIRERILTFEKKRRTHTEKWYLEWIDTVQFSKNISSKTLIETYVPNEYFIVPGDNRDDLLQMVNDFMQGSFVDYVGKSGINSVSNAEKISTLIIKAAQCCGKTSLIAKLLYDYSIEGLHTYKLFIANFRDRNNKRKSLSIDYFCNLFDVDELQFTDSVLILDSIEESELPVGEIQDTIETLSSYLGKLGCRLIVTCRSNLVDMSDLNGCLEVHLCPFSIRKIGEWFGKCDFKTNTEYITMLINTIRNKYNQVICFPYIIKICIEKALDIDSIHDIGTLYDKAFLTDADLLFSRYDPQSIRLTSNQIKAVRRCILDVSKECVYSDSSNHSISKQKLEKIHESIKDDVDFNTFVSLFFLNRDGDEFFFLHESIMEFFVAKSIYDRFVNVKSTENCKIADFIKEYVKRGALLSRNIFDFISYFSKNEHLILNDEALGFIKGFLAGRYEEYLSITGNYDSLKKFHYACFVFVINIATAIIVSGMNNHEEFDLWTHLCSEEQKNAIESSKLGNADMGLMAVYCLSNLSLNGYNFYQFDFTKGRSRNKKIYNSNLRDTNLKKAIMHGVYLIKTDMTNSSFEGARCANMEVHDSVFRECDFRDANLCGTQFYSSDLSYADLRGAKLKKTKFSGTILIGVKINVEQLRELVDFLPEDIRRNRIKIFKDERLLSDDQIDAEFAIQRPVAYQMYVRSRIMKSSSASSEDLDIDS